MKRYFVSMYTDGPATRWNVINRQTQEWVRRFPTEVKAQQYADKLNLRCEEAKQYDAMLATGVVPDSLKHRFRSA